MMDKYIKKLGLQLVMMVLCLGFATNAAAQVSVNLTTHTNGTPPGDSQIKWYKGTPPPSNTTALTAAQIANAQEGVYYVTFFSPSGTCSSPSAKYVIATNNVSALAITVNLVANHTSGTIPAGSTQVWYTDASLTTVYTTPTAATAGTYYTAFVDTASGCKSPASGPINVVIQPITKADVNVALVNQQVAGNVSTNDLIPAGTTYGTPVAATGNPNGGTIAMNADGSGNYTFTGTTPGIYTYNVPVCIATQAVPNCPTVPLVITVLDPALATNIPVANTDYATTALNTPVTVAILANDSAGNTGGTLGTPTIVSSGTNGGTATIDTNGKLVYTPATGFVGTDTVTYKVCEGASTILCSTATVVITVNAAGVVNKTVATDDFAITTGTTPATGTVLTNDKGALSTSVLTVTAQGSAASPITITGKGTYYVNTDGTYVFTPAPGFSGSVALPYKVCDDSNPFTCANATVYVTVKEVCYTDANLSTDNVSATPTGISLLKRAGAEAGAWPGVRKSAFVAIESNRKGFVVTRMTSDPAKTGDANYITNITTPQEGMLIYDTFTNCLKLYDGTKWDCFSTPACE